MTKTQNSLLNTPLRSPVQFDGAPRNPIPDQEIPPLQTTRVSLGSQRLAMHPIALQSTPLQTTSGQALDKQRLQRIPLKKQQVNLPTLSSGSVSLHAMPIRTSLPPLSTHTPASASSVAPAHKPSATNPASTPRVADSVLKPLKHSKPLKPSNSFASKPLFRERGTSSMPVLSEHRIALKGQGVRLNPVSAVQHPVRTRSSHRIHAHE